MSSLRSTVGWRGFGIVAAVAGTAWFIAAEGGTYQYWPPVTIARADTPASTANAVTDQPAFAQRLKGKLVKSYSTRFPLNENPISEGGKWINGSKDGADWYNIITRDGVAYGAVTKGEFTDPTALLTGVWGKNQHGKAKVFSRNQTEKYGQEVEIRLRSSMTPKNC